MFSKFSNLMMMAFLLLAVMSCKKEAGQNNEPDANSVKKNVILRLSNASVNGITTRSLEPAVTAATINQVTSALILFTDKNDATTGTIINKTALTGTDLAKLTGNTGTPAESGYRLANLPNTVNAVFIVLNYNTAVNAAAVVGGKITAVNAAILSVNEQNTSIAPGTNSTSSITMYGSNILTLNPVGKTWGSTNQYSFGPGAVATDYYAIVAVAPLVARVEIAAVDKKTGGSIQSFDVDGVFIKKFHQNMTLGGTPSNQVDYANVTGHTGTPSPTLNTNYYTVANYTAVDQYMRNMENPANPTPGTTLLPTTYANGNVAGYQVASGATAGIPELVVKVSNVKLIDGSTYAPNGVTDLYVVIKGFLNGGTAVTALDANKVYKLDLTGANGIDIGSITPDVHAEMKAVWVGATITPWTVVNVTPVYQ